MEDRDSVGRIAGGMLPNPRPGIGARLAWSAIAALLLAQVAAVWRYTVDDTFITLRYSMHLAAGHGPVWQVEGPRAEGYTNFLWMALLALPHRLGIDAVMLAKALGVVATFALLALVAWWTRRACLATDAPAGGPLDPSPAPAPTPVSATAAAAVAALALSSFTPTAVHAVSGMETALFTLLLLVLVALCGEATTAHGDRAAAWLGPAALALGLTRPDGNLAALLALATTITLAPARRRPRIVLGVAAGYLLPAAAYFLWRWWYYGELLPLSFYVKLGNQHGLPGAAPVRTFATWMALHLGWIVAFALVRPPRVLWPAIVAGGGMVVFYLFPLHMMGYAWRFLFPVAPILCVLAGVGAMRFADWLAARPRLAGPRTWRIAMALSMALALSQLSEALPSIRSFRWYAECLERAHVALGRRLAELPHGTLTIADAGAVPYLSGWHTIDQLGLNDRHIARTQRFDPGYVLGHRPDIAVIASREADRVVPFFWDPGGGALYQACMADGLVPVTRYRFHDTYYLIVLARPGSVWAPSLGRDPAALGQAAR